MSETVQAAQSEEQHREKVKSLVRYSKPVVVSKTAKDKRKTGADGTQETIVSNTQDILNSILPPLEYAKNGQVYREYVLSTPATRADVIALQRELDNQLQIRRARETGICPVREELYAQCFDELIRQITIICSHRGLLLVRVRDENRMTIQAYQTLYESSLAFGMRFALKGEQNRASWNIKINELNQDIEELDAEIASLEKAIEDLEEDDARAREVETLQHQSEVNKKLEEIEVQRKRLELKLLENKG